MYRRGRRNKLWYREPRFLNRKKTEQSLPPSIQCKLEAHLRIVKKICSLLPISKINVEIANFDIQKIQNPEISGVQYQQGNLYEYENLKSYLMQREDAKCQLCGKTSTQGNSFRIHHVIPRKDGGTDKPDNLSLLHEKCHTQLHRKNLHHLLKKNKQFKAETFMSTIRWKLFEELKNICGHISVSFGYMTKIKRQALKLEKDHHTDAFVIAEGALQKRSQPYMFLQKRKNNRCLQLNRNGFKPSIRRQRYKFQPKDEVLVQNKRYEVVGVFNKGSSLRVRSNTGIFNFSTKKIEEHYYNNGWQFIPYLKERAFLPQKG
jgi:hypothetical protein